MVKIMSIMVREMKFRYTGDRKINVSGTVRLSCYVCGKKTIERLRVVVKDDSGKQKIIHICRYRGCHKRFFSKVPHQLVFVGSAGKIAYRKGRNVVCTDCGNDAAGGIWIACLEKEMMRGKEGTSFIGYLKVLGKIEAKQDMYFCCESCFIKCLKNHHVGNEFLVLGP